MSAPNRWAVREAAEATFYDLKTGEAIVTLNTLKMTEVQTTGETVYARGGRGNAKLVGFSSNREARVTIQDAIFDNLALAMLTGNTINSGKTKIDKLFQGAVGATSTLVIPHKVTKIRSVHVLDTDGVTNKITLKPVTATPSEGEYSVTESTITVSEDLKDQLIRVYYETETDETAKKVVVTADQFGGSFKVVLEVMVRDEDTKQDFYGQFIIPNAKMEDDFSFNFSPEGDPSVLDLPIEILKDPRSKDMWQLVIYDNDLIA